MANRHLARSTVLQSLYEWDFRNIGPCDKDRAASTCNLTSLAGHAPMVIGARRYSLVKIKYHNMTKKSIFWRGTHITKFVIYFLNDKKRFKKDGNFMGKSR